VKGGRTRKEAEQARDDARYRRSNRGGWKAPSRRLVGEYLTGTWLPSIRAQVAPSTVTSYRQNLGHVAGHIGHVRLDALDVPMLDALYADLEAAGLARSTVRLIHTQLDPATIAVLRAHRRRQAAERLAFGAGYRAGGRVFTRPGGEPLNPDAVSIQFKRRPLPRPAC